MKKALLFVFLLVATIAVKAQENITVSFHNNGNGTLTCQAQLFDRWPSGYLVTNSCWCSVTVYEVLSNGTEVQLSNVAGNNLFKTIDVVNGTSSTVILSSGAASSKYYVQLWHYTPWNIPSAYMVQETNTTPKAAI